VVRGVPYGHEGTAICKYVMASAAGTVLQRLLVATLFCKDQTFVLRARVSAVCANAALSIWGAIDATTVLPNVRLELMSDRGLA
jgi:hypothetical protein